MSTAQTVSRTPVRARTAFRVDLLAVAGLASFVGATLVGPALALFWSSVTAGGRPSLAAYEHILRTPGLRQAIVMSPELSGAAAVIGTILGALVALSLNRMAGPRASARRFSPWRRWRTTTAASRSHLDSWCCSAPAA